MSQMNGAIIVQKVGVNMSPLEGIMNILSDKNKEEYSKMMQETYGVNINNEDGSLKLLEDIVDEIMEVTHRDVD